MTSLTVSNIHLESTGNNRIGLTTTNTVTMSVGNTVVFQANNTNVSLKAANNAVMSANNTITSIPNLSASLLFGVLATSVLGGGTANTKSFLGGDGNFSLPSLSPANVQVFTSNGTYTRSPGVTKVLAFGVGAGGSGGDGGPPSDSGPGQPGGGGASGETRFAIVIPGATETVTIGTTPPRDSAVRAANTTLGSIFNAASGGNGGTGGNGAGSPGSAGRANTGSGGVALPGANGSGTSPGKGSLGSSGPLNSSGHARGYTGAGNGGEAANAPGGDGSPGLLILIEFV